MTKVRNIAGFHAHIYFKNHQTADAEKLAIKASEEFQLKMGRVHQRPIGPHPIGSVQLSVPRSVFADLIVWLMANRGELSVFVHPLTGDDIYDHTHGAMWLGQSYTLNLSAL